MQGPSKKYFNLFSQSLIPSTGSNNRPIKVILDDENPGPRNNWTGKLDEGRLPDIPASLY